MAKARRCGELVLQRVREAGFELRDSSSNALAAATAPLESSIRQTTTRTDSAETVLRVAVETDSREAAERFSRELMPFITAGPQGTTGYAEGRPRVHPVFRYWPCLIARDAVTPQVEVLRVDGIASAASARRYSCSATVDRASSIAASQHPASQPSPEASSASCLYDIACARSGDKGTSANVGVIARSERLVGVSANVAHGRPCGHVLFPAGNRIVERFELPNLGALNFVLRGALRRSLRTDAQGKALGQILLEMPLPEDALRKIDAQ